MNAYISPETSPMRENVALLKAAQKMDEEALTAIFDQYAPSIYKYTLRLCHDPIVADNIVGDVFAQLLEQFAGGKGPRTNLRSYLYQTAYHLIINRSRDNQHYSPLLESHSDTLIFPQLGSRHDTNLQAEERIEMEQLALAMNTELTEDQRHVLILRFVEGFSLKETAEIVGKEVNNIKVIQNRGVTKLRKSLGYEEQQLL